MMESRLLKKDVMNKINKIFGIIDDPLKTSTIKKIASKIKYGAIVIAVLAVAIYTSIDIVPRKDLEMQGLENKYSEECRKLCQNDKDCFSGCFLPKAHETYAWYEYGPDNLTFQEWKERDEKSMEEYREWAAENCPVCIECNKLVNDNSSEEEFDVYIECEERLLDSCHGCIDNYYDNHYSENQS